jgi:hypothetical protein
MWENGPFVQAPRSLCRVLTCRGFSGIACMTSPAGRRVKVESLESWHILAGKGHPAPNAATLTGHIRAASLSSRLHCYTGPGPGSGFNSDQCIQHPSFPGYLTYLLITLYLRYYVPSSPRKHAMCSA